MVWEREGRSYLNPALEYFVKGLTDINNAIAHVRLFGDEGKEGTIKSMLEYASAFFINQRSI
jgi:hypothetical protein